MPCKRAAAVRPDRTGQQPPAEPEDDQLTVQAARPPLRQATRPSRRDCVIALGLALIGSGIWLWFALATRISLEDAYITFRYARNIAQSNGFVYNVGERVLGTTSPLQALLLAGLGISFGPDRIPVLASVVVPPFGIAAGVLTFLAMRRLGASAAGAAVGLLFFYLHPVVMRTSLGGMETPLVLFLMGLSLYFLAQRRAAAAALSVGLLALCRIDGLIWGGLVVAVTLLSDYRRPLRQALGFGSVVAPWLLFSWLYFGSPVPNSMLAKGVVRPGREHLLTNPLHFSRLSRFYLSGLTLSMNDWLVVASLCLIALGVLAAVRTRRRELLLLPAFLAIYPVVMYLGRAPMFEWYLAPMLLCSLPLIGVGLSQMVGLVLSGKARRPVRMGALVCLVALAVVALPAVVREAKTMPRRVARARSVQQNEFGLRRAVGLWLRQHTPEHASVAMEGIGYQGYYSERRVIDMAGLVTPKVIGYNASTGSNGTVFKHITTELQPDYIVLRSFEVEDNHHFKGGRLFETTKDRELFFRHYREARHFVAPHPELSPLLTRLTLYERLSGGPVDDTPLGESEGTPGDQKVPTPRVGAARASRPRGPAG